MTLQKRLPVYKTILQCNALLAAYILTKESGLLLRVVQKLRPFMSEQYAHVYQALDTEYIAVKTPEMYVCFNKDYKAVELSYPMCRLMVENIGKGY